MKWGCYLQQPHGLQVAARDEGAGVAGTARGQIRGVPHTEKGRDSRRGLFVSVRIRANPWLKLLSVFHRPVRHVRDPARHHQAVHRARRVHDPVHRRPDVRRARHDLRHADDRHEDGHCSLPARHHD